MEKDINNLVSLVTCHDHDKQHNTIISICGMGGIGKTTIARKVYKHEVVKASFDCFAWKCISQNLDVDEVLGDLLIQLVPGKERGTVKSMTADDLVQELHDVQMEKRCLIVLDDMWEVIHWKAIQAAFPLHGGKSKLLLTTRNKKFAKIGYVYMLGYLSESEGWELLQQITSGKTDFKTAPCFKEVGLKLVSKCRGLPLAISLLGGILKDRNSIASWEMVNRDVSLYLNTGSLDQVLSLSYNNLPYQLKLCFLYFGNFKEDAVINTKNLYPLWITEGFILSRSLRKGETLMDVAERYLIELGNMSMVQLEVDDVALTPSKAFVHDIVRGFCLKKCQEQEFLKVVDDSSYLTNNSGAYRLVVHIKNKVNVGAILDSIDQHDARHTRSLFCVYPTSMDGEIIIWPRDKVMQILKKLRVLHLEGFGFGRIFPLKLQNLIHLRSLTLFECQLDELPSSIANLPFLHTLILWLRNKVKTPNILWRMKRLRKLYFGLEGHYTDEGVKLRLHGLRELDALGGLDSEVDEISDLMELVNIRELECKVTGIDNFYVLMEYIHGNGQNLREMSLGIFDCDFNCAPKGYDFLVKSFKGGRLRELTLEAKLDKFPCYEQHFLQCLRWLMLKSNHMKEDPMKTLGQLLHLETLWLVIDSYMGQNLICHELGFPKLSSLWLCGLPNLENWRVEEGSMLNLSELRIWGCPSLGMLPDGLRFGKNLKTLKVGNMSSEFCDRLKKGGEDYYKIEHVHSVNVHMEFQ